MIAQKIGSATKRHTIPTVEGLTEREILREQIRYADSFGEILDVTNPFNAHFPFRDRAPFNFYCVTHTNVAEEIFLRVAVPPSANNRLKGVRRKIKSGLRAGQFYNGVMRSDDASQYQSAVATLARCGMRKLRRGILLGDLEVVALWHRQRKSGDILERLKDLWDALNDIVYQDDSQIKRATIERSDSQPHIPCVEVIIRPFREPLPWRSWQ